MNFDFPCPDFDKDVIQCLEHSTGMLKHCAYNSLSHLQKAWDFKEKDREMSLFRAITAEEEMATAIFIALKNAKYGNAKKIKYRSHPYKQGLYPFLTAIFKSLNPANTSDLKIQLIISEEKGKKVVGIKILLPNGFHITPVGHPLNIKAMANDNNLDNFKEELYSFANTKNKDNILQYIHEIAGLRNGLLYASASGVPCLSGNINEKLTDRIKHVLLLLRIVCLIFPYKEKAWLIQQCINIYIKIFDNAVDDYS